MLMIRLQRIGKIKQPSYRLIVSEKHRDTHYDSTEILGTYNPLGKEAVFKVKEDRVKYWLSVGAQPSPTVHNLLLTKGLVTGKKQKSVYLSKKRQAALAEKKGKAVPAALTAEAPAPAAPAEAPAA